MWHYTPMPPLQPNPTTPIEARHRAFDELRGLVIVLMTLDHVRGFVAPAGADPMNWESTSLGFFLVRWVTHLCAPTFVFLMGAAAALRNRASPHDTRAFLFTRGLWLIVLEATWVSFSWSWDPTQTYFGVLWALGGSMILLAGLTALPAPAMLAVGLAVVGGLEWAQLRPASAWWGILVRPGSLTAFGHTIRCSYPLLPWFAAAAVGWSVAMPLRSARPARLFNVGMGMLLAFALYRGGVDSDPNPWAMQDAASMTVADFLSPSKYPPSVAFYLLTLGAAILVLAGAHRRRGAFWETIARMGRVPMMFYLLHLPLAHAVGNALAWLVHGQPRVPASEPVRIWVILGAWAAVVAVLVPVCTRWDSLKRRRRDLWWLRYL